MNLIAQVDLGSKPDLVVQRPEPPTSIGGAQMLQIVVALAVVIALLKWGLPALLGRKAKRVAHSQSVAVGEGMPLGAGAVHIVEAEGRRFLIGVTSQSIATLAELGQAKREDAFFEMVDRAVVKMPEDPQSTLDRLQRLTG